MVSLWSTENTVTATRHSRPHAASPNGALKDYTEKDAASPRSRQHVASPNGFLEEHGEQGHADPRSRLYDHLHELPSPPKVLSQHQRGRLARHPEAYTQQQGPAGEG